jgi:hypothetical protein
MAQLPNPFSIPPSLRKAGDAVSGAVNKIPQKYKRAAGAVGGALLSQAVSNSKTLTKAAGAVGTAATAFAVGKTVIGKISEVKARLEGSGLDPSGAFSQADQVSEVNTVAPEDDWRMRISVGQSSGIFYQSTNPGILAPLQATNGVLFPYTPQVTINYANNYNAMTPTHSINSIQSYTNSDVSSITVNATFTAQNQQEADYVLASLHFFRSASKMFFGSSDTGNAGNPQPVLFLNGFGKAYFNNVPVILTSFVHTMTDDVDFISTTSTGLTGMTMIPTVSSISVTLTPQYSRIKMSNFNLDRFASGDLLMNGFI